MDIARRPIIQRCSTGMCVQESCTAFLPGSTLLILHQCMLLVTVSLRLAEMCLPDHQVL